MQQLKQKLKTRAIKCLKNVGLLNKKSSTKTMLKGMTEFSPYQQQYPWLLGTLLKTAL